MNTACNNDSFPYQLDREFWVNPDRFVALAERAGVNIEDVGMLAESVPMFLGEPIARDIFLINWNERTAAAVIRQALRKLQRPEQPANANLSAEAILRSYEKGAERAVAEALPFAEEILMQFGWGAEEAAKRVFRESAGQKLPSKKPPKKKQERPGRRP